MRKILSWFRTFWKNENTNLEKTVSWIIILGVLFTSGLLSVHLGKDFNWDLQNYHYYNAYAFLNHRLNFDIAPAMLQTYFNPLMDIPFYWMTQHFTTRLIGFILGCIHGLNLVIIFLIFGDIARFRERWFKLFVSISLIAVTATGVGFRAELGNTMNDNLTSIFVLSALLLVIKGVKKLDTNRVHSGALFVIIAGMDIGFGTGLKETIAYCALASAFALMVIPTSWRNKVVYFIIYGFSGLIGGMLSGGIWFWTLWTEFKNPFFPYLNNIFASPYLIKLRVFGSGHRPLNLLEYLFGPVFLSLNSLRVSQIPFLDLRFALIYVLAISWLCVFLIRSFRARSFHKLEAIHDFVGTNTGTFLLVFLGVGYGLWIVFRPTYRYLIPLEFLVPLCFYIITERLVRSVKARAVILITATLALLVFYKPYLLGRVGWRDPYFMVNVKSFVTESPTGALVIILGRSPMAYVIPEYPPNFRFIRPEGNFVLKDNGELYEEMNSLIGMYKGPIYILYNKLENSVDRRVTNVKGLTVLDLKYEVGTCTQLSMNIPYQRLVMCALSQALP